MCYIICLAQNSDTSEHPELISNGDLLDSRPEPLSLKNEEN